MTIELSVPAIHMNGSGKKALQDALENTCKTLHSAKRSMTETAPHMRDYYIIGVDGGQAAFILARDQYMSRLERLNNIYEELVAVHNAIDDNLTVTTVELA